METISASLIRFPGAATFREKAAAPVKNVGRKIISSRFFFKNTRQQRQKVNNIVVNKAVIRLAPPQQTANGSVRNVYKNPFFSTKE